MRNGLEVIDFREEDPEFAADKFFARFRNPNDVDEVDCDRNDSLFKYEFLEHVAQGPGVLRKEMDSLPCFDVDVIGSDHNSDVPIACNPLELATEDTACSDDDCDLGAQCSSASPCHGTGRDVDIDVNESRIHITVPQPRALLLSDESPFLFTSKCCAAFTDFLPTNEPSDAKTAVVNKMNVISLSSATPDIEEDAVTLSRQPSIPHLVGSEMDNVDFAVDYVEICGAYYAGCLVTFSSNGVKIDHSDADDSEALIFERLIEDIIRIESQLLQRFDTVMVKLQVLPDNRGQSRQKIGVSGIEELEFAVVDSNWSRKWEEIITRNVKYSALWNVVNDIDVAIDEGTNLFRQKPYYPIFGEAFEDIIYPKGDSDAVSISKRDVDLLQPEAFINDTIIDFYINYLKNQIPKEEKQRYHFFNSFFFRKLADLDKDPSSALDGRAAFLRVRKWTRKVDLFGKDYIFIPVNFSLHWSLLVFCHLGELESSNEQESQRIPCVLHMNSIKGTHAGLKDLVQSYLWEEWKERHDGAPEDLSKNFLNLRFVPLELPQQENSFDCGLFLLHYLELFLMDAPSNFSPFNINEDTSFLTEDWFPPFEASLKRTLIQRLISELLDNRSREVFSSDCSDGEKVGGLEFVCENYTAANCHGGSSNSIAGPGIEMTLLEASSERNQRCANDPSLVLRELFEPEVDAGSLLAHCSSFGRPNYFYDHSSAMSQMEDNDRENGDQLMFLPGETAFQQMVNTAPQISGNPYSFEGLGARASWKLSTTVEEEDNETSLESSDCASVDSDVGIIESYQIEDINHDDSKNIGEQISEGMENAGCLTEGFYSASEDMPESVADECGEDTNKMPTSHGVENAGCQPQCLASASQELPRNFIDTCKEDTEKMYYVNGDLFDGPENPPDPMDECPSSNGNGWDEDFVKATVFPEEQQQPPAKRQKLCLPDHLHL